MALCRRCGRHTEPDTELCDVCGGHPERDAYATAGAPRLADPEAGVQAGDQLWPGIVRQPVRRDLPEPDRPTPAETTAQDLRPLAEADPDEILSWQQSLAAVDPATTVSRRASRGRGLRIRLAPPGHEADEAGDDEYQVKPVRLGRLAGRVRLWRIVLPAAGAVLVIAAGTVALTFGWHGSAGRNPGPHSSGKPTDLASRAAKTPPAGHKVVTVTAAAALAPHAVAAVSFLTRYFSAINDHDYAAYERLFSTSLRGSLSAPAFAAGYGTTRDSGIVLRNITVLRPGEIAADVTFTSHQQAAGSATNTACTAWKIAIYLVRHDHRYEIQSPPRGYQPSAADCA